MSKKRLTEAEVNYRFVGSATKSIHRSVKQASRDLQSDYEKILRTYTEKGGFSSRQEALDYLNGHVQPEGYQALVEAARKIQDPDVRRRELTRLSTDAYKFRLSRAKACDIAQGYHARQLQEDIRKDLGQAKAKTAVTASEQALFNAQKAVGTGIGFDLPNTEQIKQIAYGTATEKKIKLFSDSEMKGIREVMDAGILSGRSWDDVAKQCEAHTDKEFCKVRRLVRTEMAQASVDAEIAELEELGYGEYEVHCTLDEVTCEICGQYDGEVFKVGDIAHLPTYHPNCRCYITPVTDGKGSRSARDAKGKSVKVPAGMRYPEWREKYAPELKVEHKKFDKILEDSHGMQLPGIMTKKPHRDSDMPDDSEIDPNYLVKSHKKLNEAFKEGRLGEHIKLDPSLEQCDVKSLGRTFTELDKLAEEFPTLKDCIGEINTKSGHQAASISPNWKGDKAIISLNPFYFEDDVLLHNVYQRDVHEKFHPRGTTAKHIGVHEGAHALIRQIIAKMYSDPTRRAVAWRTHEVSSSIVEEAYRRILARRRSSKSLKSMRAKNSEYALENTSETIAESVADWMANGDNANDLSKEIVLILKEKL